MTLTCPQAVLERGVLTYFRCRADASSGVRRQEFRYLDGARVAAGESPHGATMVLRFNDGTMHRLRCDDGDDRVSRQVSQVTQGQPAGQSGQLAGQSGLTWSDSRSVRSDRVSQQVSQVTQGQPAGQSDCKGSAGVPVRSHGVSQQVSQVS